MNFGQLSYQITSHMGFQHKTFQEIFQQLLPSPSHSWWDRSFQTETQTLFTSFKEENIGRTRVSR